MQSLRSSTNIVANRKISDSTFCLIHYRARNSISSSLFYFIDSHIVLSMRDVIFTSLCFPNHQHLASRTEGYDQPQ